MKGVIFIFAIVIVFTQSCNMTKLSNNYSQHRIAIIVHGGAGNYNSKRLSDNKQALYKKYLRQAIDSSFSILESEGSAEDAVIKAISILENAEVFNAGKGSVFNSNAKIEMDASIMRGDTKSAGAVTGLRHIKNPISLAAAVMNNSEHVLLGGEQAEEFAKLYNVEFEREGYFKTEYRYKKYLKAKKRDKVELDHDEKMGTVGAVAIDINGNIVAGTSTGGLNYKKFGRIGDSALIGCGTYADNSSCGISCTGVGEYFIRSSAAHEISSLMKYKSMTLKEAIRSVLFDQIVPMGGRGGVIGIDRNGNIACDFTTKGMFRAWKTISSEKISIFEKQ